MVVGAMSRSRSPHGCGPAIRPMCGKHSWAVASRMGLCRPDRRRVRRVRTHGLGSDVAGDVARRGDLSGQGVGGATGSHRGNVSWFNQRVLHDAGIAAPGPGYTPETFGSDLAKVAASGRTPLCLGGKDRFTATELFENTLLGVIGPTDGRGFETTEFDWPGSQLKDALTRFGDIVSRADPSAGALTWDQAAKKLASGDCAFLSMNDSVYGELVANGAAEGKDFGYVPYPGTAGAYLAIVDTFVVSAEAKDG